MRRILGLVLVVALTIFASLAETFRNNLWTSYRDYTSPYLTDLPTGSPRVPAAARVVLILIRGLRLDVSRQMPTLNAFRERGADMIVQNDPPTYRLPVWTTLFSGSTAEVHGITTNYAPRTTSASSIFHTLQIAGEPTAIIGSQEFGDAYSGDVQRFEPVDNPDVSQRDDDAIRLTLDTLKDTATPMSLVCVELTAIDDTAQIDPGSTATAISVTDSRIKTLVGTLDLSATTVVILSDHGATRTGGDGGAEPEVALAPLVMLGASVSPGTQQMVKAVDVAPTLAALTGAPLPTQAQGQPALSALSLPEHGSPAAPITPTTALTDTAIATDTLAPLPGLLWASAVQLTTFYEHWSEVTRQPRFAAELLRARQDGIRSGDPSAYQNYFIELNARAAAARRTRLDTERAQRLPLAIGATLLLIALLGLSLTSRRWQSLVGVAAYVLAWYALFTIVRGHGFSLSMFGNGDSSPFLNAAARDSAALLTAISVLVALTTGKHEDGLDAIATVLVTLMLIVGVQVAQAVWFYFQWGNSFTWSLPDSSTLVTTLVALTQASALSIRIVPELPNVPVPLVIAFLTLLVHSAVRRTQSHEGYGRMR